MKRFEALDGWRGISILFVLAGHLLPLGPSALQLNATVATSGMALFFILSGFLITNQLLKDQTISVFFVRRLSRIVPLAWLVLILSLVLTDASKHQWFSNLLFYSNWPPISLFSGISHFWSLCLEMQFYFGIALLVLFLGKKSLYLLPIFAILITSNRIYFDIEIAITT